HRVHVAIWEGLIWVSLAGQPGPLEEQLRPQIEARLADYGKFERYRLGEQTVPARGGAGGHDPAVQVAGHRSRRLRRRRLRDRGRPLVVLADRADRAAEAAGPAARRRPALLRHGGTPELLPLAGQRPRDRAQVRAGRAGPDAGRLRVAVSAPGARGGAV